MNPTLLHDLHSLRVSDRREIQEVLNIKFNQGDSESTLDFCKRLLIEIDNQGKIRGLEILMAGLL